MPGPPTLSKPEIQKMAGMGIGVALFLAALFGFVTIPSIRKSAELKKEIIKLKEDIKRSEVLIASASQMQSRLTAIQQRLNDYQAALPKRSDMPNILQNISDMAAGSKVKLLKIEPAPADKLSAAKQQGKQDLSKAAQTIYTEMPIQIEVKGGYHALGKFINDIETSKNIMAIGDLDIGASSADMFNHGARLLIIAYVLREETPVK